jgi:hypothetical protein
MQALLVRIGIDHAYGGWNAPADPASRRFVYVPIPERPKTRFHPGCRRGFDEVIPEIRRFADAFGLDAARDLKLPAELDHHAMHLDPDFAHLTYGDVGDRRGAGIRKLTPGDLLVFYAGLRSIDPAERRLIYALTGLLAVEEIVEAADVPRTRWKENAHTRKVKRGASDIIVRGRRGSSGRFDQFIPIGEWRAGAYRVRRDVLQAWGGLSVKDGFIQRSARPPRFLDADRFSRWLEDQEIELIAHNNEPAADRVSTRLILVHLRRPNRRNPRESRADPFWEFGSFGCTGCHHRNLMHPGRADELEGASLGMVQGGPLGFRLLLITPPITIVRHMRTCEARWRPAEMPWRYDRAPLIVDNAGRSDFPSLLRLIRPARRSTWMGRFSSAFRSRRAPLPADTARAVFGAYRRLTDEATADAFARSYIDALPYPPPSIDRTRERSYRRLLTQAGGRTGRERSGCRRC